MAHELTFDRGIAQVFSVKQTPWHREGHVLTEAPTYERALELAGLDFEVEVVPDYIRRNTLDGNDHYYVPSDTGRKVLRTDNGKELGTVGTGYTPLQNADAFRVLRPLLDSGVVSLETGGSLREGSDVWLLSRFNIEKFGPVVREVFTDEVIPFGLIANNHNGRRGVLLQLTPIRVICANTLGASEARLGKDEKVGRAYTLKHTANVEEKVIEAAENLFRGIVERYEVIARQYRLLKATVLQEQEFKRAVLDLIAPDPRENPSFNPEASRAQLVLDRADQKRAELRRLWDEGDGHQGDHSAWEAYNGVVQAIDHDVAGLFPIRGGAWRTASLLDGTYAQRKGQVLDELVRVSARKNPSFASA